MSVRQSLLAILHQGPCYGYQLRAEFERRTGSTWPLNVGQIYNTLDRLERDGLVSKGSTDEHGHVYYEITDAGAAEVASWLTSAVDRGQARDELAMKLAVAATLPGVDVSAVLLVQREVSAALLEDLGAEVADLAVDSPEQLARALMLDSRLFQAEAELRWLDHVAAQLARHPSHTIGLGLATERPKRGRPARVA